MFLSVQSWKLTVRRLSSWSEKVSIYVGPYLQRFHVNKCLLKLHSGYFRNRFAAIEKEEDQKLFLPTVDPSLFAEFICWMSTGWELPPIRKAFPKNTKNLINRAWLLGHFLHAAGKNFAIDQYQFFCQGWEDKDEKTLRWPDIQDVRFVYQQTNDESNLRRFFTMLWLSTLHLLSTQWINRNTAPGATLGRSDS